MKLKSLLLIAASIPTLVFAQSSIENYQTQYLFGIYHPYNITSEEVKNYIDETIQKKKEVAEDRKEQVEHRKELVESIKDKITGSAPEATMSSPTPPVSSTVNSQMPVNYPGQSAIPQPAVGMPPPTIRAEMPGQVGQSAIPQPAVGMLPPTIRSEISAPSYFVPPPRVEHQMQGGAPAVNVGPGPLNPSIGR